jgi:hypothetical protein
MPRQLHVLADETAQQVASRRPLRWGRSGRRNSSASRGVASTPATTANMQSVCIPGEFYALLLMHMSRMMLTWPGLLAAFAVAMISSGASANDSTAVMAAGGIELTESTDVVMESEDLWIREDLVRVTYKFRSTKDVETKVAFPLPPIPVCEEECYEDFPISDGPNPMEFKLKVDGKPKSFKTARKKQTSFSTVEETEAAHEGKPARKVRRRVKDVEIQITHYWNQVFPKDRVVTIEHEYVPAAGGSFLGSYTDAKRGMPEYCLGEKLLSKLVKSGTEYSYREVHYILKTGANWRGPIGRFKLTLVKQHPRDIISTCILDTRRVSPTTFEVARENFEPTGDLAVLFIPRGSSQ